MAYLGETIGKLGFGLMRLPMIDGEVDLKQTKAMVDLFLSSGFTYFDTAYGYLDGKSEEAVKTALVERYPRESFQLATKLPAWAGPQSAEEAKQMFWTSLERTGAGYFDYYLLHNLGYGRSEAFDTFGIWEFAQELKSKGLVKHVGFSIHDHAQALDDVLQAHPEMEFVQLQINYADWESRTVESRRCYEVAQKHQKPIIVMEPVKGGSLAKLPPEAEKLFLQLDPQASASSWAMRFAASLDGLVTVLSGMSNMEQLQDNIATMQNFRPLTPEEQAVVAQVRTILDGIPQVPCTECRYCIKDCPQEIAIPGIFTAMNNELIFHNTEGAKANYAWETRDGGIASKCVECGQCEIACPQSIKIPAELKHAVEMFGR